MNSAGERFQHILKEIGESQYYIADFLEVTQASVSRWCGLESLSRTVKKKMQKLKETYQVNLNWIATGEGEPFLSSSPTVVKETKGEYGTMVNVEKKYVEALEIVLERFQHDQKMIDEIQRLNGEIVKLHGEITELKRARKEREDLESGG